MKIVVLGGCALGRQGLPNVLHKDEFEFLLPASADHVVARAFREAERSQPRTFT